MYKRALELATQLLGEDVNSDNQLKQLRAKKEQLTNQYKTAKEQLTKQYNQNIDNINAQIDKLGGAIDTSED
jgi:uncharacterized protein (DUF885 family)